MAPKKKRRRKKKRIRIQRFISTKNETKYTLWVYVKGYMGFITLHEKAVRATCEIFETRLIQSRLCNARNIFCCVCDGNVRARSREAAERRKDSVRNECNATRATCEIRAFCMEINC